MVLLITSTFLSFGTKSTPPKELSQFNVPTVRMFLVLIENYNQGKVWAIDGGTKTYICDVVKPATSAQRASDGFWAAHYVRSQTGAYGCVAATAVNAIHLRCGPSRIYDPKKPNDWLASEISIIPFTELENAGTSQLVVSSPGGNEIFNNWSPYVGNPVYAYDKNKWVPLDEYFLGSTRSAPKDILIDVRRPTKHPRYIEFENWTKGDTIKGVTMGECGGVFLLDDENNRVQVAKVLQRVTQTGRFIGSEYADTGQVRANHGGVLDLSTSRWRGKIADENLRGGVQIIPANHAKYLHYNLGQNWFIGGGAWMIIGPLSSSPEDLLNSQYTNDVGLLIEPLEGAPPLFSSYIRPYLDQGDYESSFRFYISEDFGRTWRSPPEVEGVPLPGEVSPVSYWTHIRLELGR